MDAGNSEELARDALSWLLRLEINGTWPWIPGDESDPGLYNGGAGVVLALLEAHAHFGDDRYADAALRGATALAASVSEVDDCSLYFGLTGIAVTLAAVHELLGDEQAKVAARHAHERVWAGFDGQRWDEFFELLKGNAGIALGMLRLGDADGALRAARPYLHAAEPTYRHAVNWESRAGFPGRAHHVAHGTLGIVIALAALATRHAEFTEPALAGAADVLSRNEDGERGFLVPHSDPPHKPELNPRYSYGWCNGPAGDAQAFRWLYALTGDELWRTAADRCWHTVLDSGLPARLRPGFWDNNGRCCGTAGVLALANDRIAEQNDDGSFADTLVADLATRAHTDADGARWANHDHRTDTDLPPRTGWAMGSAGIVRELLRHARLRSGGEQDYAVPLPDQLPGTPVSACGAG